MAVAWIVPAISAGFWSGTSSPTHELAMEMLYFSPLPALIQIVDPYSFQRLPLWFGGNNIWLATTLIYFGLAALCLMLTSLAAKRSRQARAWEVR